MLYLEIESVVLRQKEQQATEATRAMRRELDLVFEEPKNIGIVYVSGKLLT